MEVRLKGGLPFQSPKGVLGKEVIPIMKVSLTLIEA